jgi:hypothetical protein
MKVAILPRKTAIGERSCPAALLRRIREAKMSGNPTAEVGARGYCGESSSESTTWVRRAPTWVFAGRRTWLSDTRRCKVG